MPLVAVREWVRWLSLAAYLGGCGSEPDGRAADALVDRTASPTLHFVVRDLVIGERTQHEKKLQVIVPSDWSLVRAFGFQSDPKDPTASHVSFTSTCSVDPCSVGNFQADIDADLQERDNVVSAKVLKDIKTANSRAIVTKDVSNRIVVEKHWWVGDKPAEVFTCSFVIMDNLVSSQAAFEKACDLAIVK